MRFSTSSLVLVTALAHCVGLPTAFARPYQGYVLRFELTPDDDGNVVKCTLRRTTHYSPTEVQDPADFHPSTILLKNACSTFSRWKLEVIRDRRGSIQPADAPWSCLIRDDAPDKIDCHPSGHERVPID